MKINFELPSRIEWAAFILAGMLLAVFDWTQNAFQSSENLQVKVFGVPAIYLFWITFILYHIVLFWAYARAIKKRDTTYKLDWAFGSLAFIGVFGLLVGGIGAMYYQPEQALPFFFNISQITVYHFWGILIEIIGLGYFIITE